MKSKGPLWLIAFVLILGGYAFFDYKKETTKDLEKTEMAHLLTQNKDQINEIHIEKGAKSILLKRSADGWQMEEPLKDWADNEGIETFISTAESESFQDIVKEGPGIDWALYGLDKPMGQITFKSSSGQQDVYSISSKKNFEQNTYLKKNKEDKVYVVSGTWQARVSKDESELRDRRLLRHKIANVDKIHFKSDETSWDLANKNGQWYLTDKPNQKLDQNRIRELMQFIAQSRAQEFLAERTPNSDEKKKYFLNPAKATLDLQIGDKKWEAILGKSPTNQIYAWVNDPVFLLKMESDPLGKLFRIKPTDLYIDAAKKAKPVGPEGFNPEMKLDPKALPQSQPPAQEKK